MSSLNEWRRTEWGASWRAFYDSLPVMEALRQAHQRYELCMARARNLAHKGGRKRALVFGMVAGLHGAEIARQRSFLGLTRPPPSPKMEKGGRRGRP